MWFRCHRLLKKTMFYPEYVPIKSEKMRRLMEMETREFLDEDLQCFINTAINVMCKDLLFYHLTFRPMSWLLKN